MVQVHEMLVGVQVATRVGDGWDMLGRALGAAGAETGAQAAASKSTAHGVVRGKVSWSWTLHTRLCTV